MLAGEQPFLWAVIFFTIGIIFGDYYGQYANIYAIAGIAVFFGILVWWGKYWYMAVAMLLVGMAVLWGQNLWHNQQFPTHHWNGVYFIDGNITQMEGTADKQFAIIQPTQINDSPTAQHFMVRLSSDNKEIMHQLSQLPKGCNVAFKAELFGLPEPISPDQRDYNDHWKKSQIASMGRIVGALQVAPNCQTQPPSPAQQFAEIINDEFSPHIAPIINAMTTGFRFGIDNQTNQDFQLSGMVHILSISGLHISLIAGLFYIIFRRVLLWVLPFAPSLTIKKISAILAIGLIILYGFFAEYSPAMVRAIIMFILFLLAVLINRFHINMRLLALAYILLLAFDGQLIYNAGFQLSFISMAALIILYHEWAQNARQFIINNLPFAGVWLGLLLLLGSGMTIGLLTAPVVLYYFAQVNFVGFITNIIAIPLMDLVLMPLLLLKMIFWDSHIFNPAITMATEYLLQLAKWGAGQNQLLFTTAQLPNSLLYVWLLGLLIISMARHPLKYWLFAPMVLYIFTTPTITPPQLIWAKNGKIMGININGVLYTNTTNPYINQQWQKIYNIPIGYLPLGGYGDNNSCVGNNCIIPQTPLGAIITNPTIENWYDDCQNAKIIIMPQTKQYSNNCPAMVMDYEYFAQNPMGKM